jgi:hypothetical protein
MAPEIGSLLFKAEAIAAQIVNFRRQRRVDDRHRMDAGKFTSY